MKRLFIAALAAVTLLALAAPAAAITNGTPDGDEHPMVGAISYRLPGVAGEFGCTGTLISARVLVTAGHCTAGAVDVQVTFAEDVRDPERVWLPAVAHTFDSASFHDLGAVVLDQALPGVPEVAELPSVGLLDSLWRSPSRRSFTTVGYGIQGFVAVPGWGLQPAWGTDGSRRSATPRLVDLNGTHGFPRGSFAVFSNNPGRANTGGTCFGDSGGPYFVEDSRVIGAITSYTVGPCGGTSGAYRLDRPDELAWLGHLMATHG